MLRSGRHASFRRHDREVRRYRPRQLPIPPATNGGCVGHQDCNRAAPREMIVISGSTMGICFIFRRTIAFVGRHVILAMRYVCLMTRTSRVRAVPPLCQDSESIPLHGRS